MLQARNPEVRAAQSTHLQLCWSPTPLQMFTLSVPRVFKIAERTTEILRSGMWSNNFLVKYQEKLLHFATLPKTLTRALVSSKKKLLQNF